MEWIVSIIAILAGILGVLIWIGLRVTGFLKSLNISDLFNLFDELKANRETADEAQRLNAPQEAGLARKYEWLMLENKDLQEKILALHERIAAKDLRISKLEGDLIDAKAQLQNQPLH